MNRARFFGGYYGGAAGAYVTVLFTNTERHLHFWPGVGLNVMCGLIGGLLALVLA